MHLLAQMACRTGPGQPGRVGAYVYIFPYQNQARKVVWNGMDNEGRRFLHAFPEEYIENKNEAEMFIRFKNGATFQVYGGDDPDKLVGINPVGIVFSEYALTDPRCWQLLSPIVNANGGWALFNSTPRGKNHFKVLLDMAKNNPDEWYYSFETSKTLGVLSPEDLRRSRIELGDESLFQQEMMCSFEAPLQGAYYETQLRLMEDQDRIRPLPIDTSLPVDTGWDLGMADQTAIWFVQPYRETYRLVGYYENNGEGLSHYVQYVASWADKNKVRLGDHYAPHDIAVREFSGEGKSRLQVAAQLGLRFRVVKRHSIEDGIEVVRNFLSTCYADPDKLGKGWECLKSYCKEWDDANQVFRSRPLHNWASHGADALRTYAMGRKRLRGDSSKPPVTYSSAYNIFDT